MLLSSYIPSYAEFKKTKKSSNVSILGAGSFLKLSLKIMFAILKSNLSKLEMTQIFIR